MNIRTKSLRDAFGHSLLNIGNTNNKVVVLDSDVAHPTRSYLFEKDFPDRFIQTGIEILMIKLT